MEFLKPQNKVYREAQSPISMNPTFHVPYFSKISRPRV